MPEWRLLEHRSDSYCIISQQLTFADWFPMVMGRVVNRLHSGNGTDQNRKVNTNQYEAWKTAGLPITEYAELNATLFA